MPVVKCLFYINCTSIWCGITNLNGRSSMYEHVNYNKSQKSVYGRHKIKCTV